MLLQRRLHRLRLHARAVKVRFRFIAPLLFSNRLELDLQLYRFSLFTLNLQFLFNTIAIPIQRSYHNYFTLGAWLLQIVILNVVWAIVASSTDLAPDSLGSFGSLRSFFVLFPFSRFLLTRSIVLCCSVALCVMCCVRSSWCSARVVVLVQLSDHTADSSDGRLASHELRRTETLILAHLFPVSRSAAEAATTTD